MIHKIRVKPLVLAMMVAAPACAQNNDGDAQQAQSAELLEEVTVEGVRRADLNARGQERDKDIFSSIIATDDIGDFADQNVAESLQRLPGVTLQRTEGEGNHVAVRGLGPSFVSVSMNGTQTGMGTDDDRAVGLDALPSDLLSTIEVFKTLTPDMELNSIGGAVNVKSISAFDRGKDSLKFKVQSHYSDKREEFSPKVALNGTRLFLEDKLGVGFSVSHEERAGQVDEVRHHSTGEMMFRQQNIPETSGPEILAPRQLETRQEISDRTRTAGSLNLEFKPDDASYYYLKSNHTYFEDVDVALREFFDFQDAGSGEVAYVNPDTGEFALTDVDVFHQYFIQEGEKKSTAFSLGGENLFGDGWTLDYEYAHSKSTFDKPDGRRVQFRESDLVVMGRGGSDFINGQVITPEQAAALGGFLVSDFSSSDIQGDASDLNNFHYDNLFLEESYSTDTVDSIGLNLRKDLVGGAVNYIKAGFLLRERDRDRDKNRWSYDPDDGAEGCGEDAACLAAIDSNLADYATYAPSGSDFAYPFVIQSEVERIIAASRLTRDAATLGEISIESTKNDYGMSEDTAAAYIMAEFQLAENMSLIAGVRYSQTEYSSNGYLAIENDDFQFAGDENSKLDIALPLEDTTRDYHDFFPSLHLRYEPKEDLLVRASLWTSFTRPTFNQARAYAKLDSDVELCNPNTGDCDDQGSKIGDPTAEELQDFTLAPYNSVQVGNPNLVAMTSTNFDASVGWYPSENLFIQAAVFYKDIDDFIVDVAGISMAVGEMPVDLPWEQITAFTVPADLVLENVDITVNGDSAKVYGAELSYSQFFRNGLFIQGNLTLLDSEAVLDDSIRVGEVALPDQADTTANLTLGWENDWASLRLIGNYRSEILEQVGACSAASDASDPHSCKVWADRYMDEIYGLDFKAKVRVTDRVSVYFDAINLTDEADRRYFQGNAQSGGNILYQLEDYGRKYQLGVDVNF